VLLATEQWDAKCLRIAAILAAITGIVARETEQRRTMGTFIYEGHQKAEIEDRALVHLQAVITAKLRRDDELEVIECPIFDVDLQSAFVDERSHDVHSSVVSPRTPLQAGETKGIVVP